MNCPTCGRPGYNPAPPLPPCSIKTADELVAALRRLGKDNRTRDVYQDKDARGYWITYGHERVHSAAVGEALERGLIAPTFPHINYGYWSLPARAAECHAEWHTLQRKKVLRARAASEARQDTPDGTGRGMD